MDPNLEVTSPELIQEQIGVINNGFDQHKSNIFPPEIMEGILEHVDYETLALSILLVSKSFNELTAENSKIWQKRCQEMDITIDGKTSWKKQFFVFVTPLFPIYGYTIGRATYQDLLKDPRIQELNNAPMLTTSSVLHIDGFRFYCNDILFSMISDTRTWIMTEFGPHIANPPAKWQKLGFHSHHSYFTCKQFFLLRHSNVKIWHYRDTTFTARMSSIVKEGDLYYEVFADFRIEGSHDNPAMQPKSMRGLQVSYAQDKEEEYLQRVRECAQELADLKQHIRELREKNDIRMEKTLSLCQTLRSNDTEAVNNELTTMTQRILGNDIDPDFIKIITNQQIINCFPDLLQHSSSEVSDNAIRFCAACIQKQPQMAQKIHTMIQNLKDKEANSTA